MSGRELPLHFCTLIFQSLLLKKAVLGPVPVWSAEKHLKGDAVKTAREGGRQDVFILLLLSIGLDIPQVLQFCPVPHVVHAPGEVRLYTSVPGLGELHCTRLDWT